MTATCTDVERTTHDVTRAPLRSAVVAARAQGDDPARDLAIIGGPVHGGPWYVPLAEEQVTAFVDEYVRARGELGEVPAGIADVGALRERMRAWTAYERTAMLVHVASRAATRASHRQVLPVLQGTLAAELGLDG